MSPFPTMPEPKQPHLNGAFYGPSIPSPKKAYHRLQSGRSVCNPFTCCHGCISSCAFKTTLTILIITGMIIFSFWLVFRPNRLKFHVEDASLTRFVIVDNTLHYDLALNMSVGNPNKRLSVWYDIIEVNAFYGGKEFESARFNPFYQGHKNTTSLHMMFLGQKLLLLGSNQITNYEQDMSSGVYDIDIKVHTHARFRIWWIKFPKFKPKIDCLLKVPLNSMGQSTKTFESTRCGFHW